MGYEVHPTQYSGDGGVDIILKDSKGIIYVQCKAHKSKVGVAVVRELFGVMTSKNVDRGIVVSLHGFTKGAYALADKTGIVLKDIDGLIQELRLADVKKQQTVEVA